MHIHILGVCGTFMGSLAQLAKSLGYRVTGADFNVYPPMSTQLEAAGIELIEGFSKEQLDLSPDIYVVGNVVSRGNPLMEAVLDRGLPYTSGPEFLARHLLKDKWVLAVSGTHGKTTTSSMLAWVLDYCGYNPSYLIGGVPANLPASARLTDSAFFVIEADEYDTAFFDKRSKFIHYQPKTLVINNLEFDHSDIFPDLSAIQRQFHHVIRTVPGIGKIIHPAPCDNIQAVIDMGCWSDVDTLGESGTWSVENKTDCGGRFDILHHGQVVGCVDWSLLGEHNVNNALAAVAAARHVGVLPEQACEALGKFEGVKRRLELIAELDGVRVYDDFAHHPTAIETTLSGLRAKVGSEPIFVLIEPRSNTMREGVFKSQLDQATALADRCYWFQPANSVWLLKDVLTGSNSFISDSTEELLQKIIDDLEPGAKAHIVIMSNGGFEGIHTRLVAALEG